MAIGFLEKGNCFEVKQLSRRSSQSGFDFKRYARVAIGGRLKKQRSIMLRKGRWQAFWVFIRGIDPGPRKEDDPVQEETMRDPFGHNLPTCKPYIMLGRI